jgi:hypothetical protein
MLWERKAEKQPNLPVAGSAKCDGPMAFFFVRGCFVPAKQKSVFAEHSWGIRLIFVFAQRLVVQA